MSLVGKDSFCSCGLKRQIQLQEVKKNDKKKKKKKKKNAKTAGASLAFCSVHMNPQSMSRNVRKRTIRHLRPAKIQISLRIAQSDQNLRWADFT